MEKFASILWGLCPFPTLHGYDHNSDSYCPECGLSDKNGPKELIGPQIVCLGGSMMSTYRSYINRHEIDEKAALARLIVIGTKLLAYLDSKE